MTDPLLEEVYRAREKLWQRGGGTMRGVCEYLRECGRRAKERGVLWITSEEEREAIGAEVRARLAREGEAGEGTLCVGEERGVYGEGNIEKIENPGGDIERGKRERMERGQAGDGERAFGSRDAVGLSEEA